MLNGMQELSCSNVFFNFLQFVLLRFLKYFVLDRDCVRCNNFDWFEEMKLLAMMKRIEI